MRRIHRIVGAALSIALASGTLAAGSSAALADQYPRNWQVKSTDLPSPLYDFRPGHNGRMVNGAATPSAAPAASGPVKYDFTPGSSNFHRVN